MATKEQQTAADKEFAEQFNKDDAPKTTQTDDQAFGLDEGGTDASASGTGGDTADATGGAAATETTTDTGADTTAAAAPAAGTDDAAAKAEAEAERLAAKEAELAAREKQVAEREAALATTNPGETQSTTDANANGNDTASGTGTGTGDDDAAAALAADFGPDFVNLLRRFFQQECKAHYGNGGGDGDAKLGALSATIDEVIEAVRDMRNESHFNAIRAAHEDFQEVIESPEFKSWKGGQSAEEQARIQRVCDAGSAREIVAMLTEFKKSRNLPDDSALEAAETAHGSGGLTLPRDPSAAEDYQRAWEQA